MNGVAFEFGVFQSFCARMLTGKEAGRGMVIETRVAVCAVE